MKYSVCSMIKSTMLCGYSDYGDTVTPEEYQDDALEIYYKLLNRNIIKIERYKIIALKKDVLVIYLKDMDKENLFDLILSIEDHLDYEVSTVYEYFSPDRWRNASTKREDIINIYPTVRTEQDPENVKYKIIAYDHRNGGGRVTYDITPDDHTPIVFH